MMAQTRFESLEDGEAKYVTQIIKIMRRKQEKDFKPGSTLRDAHAKHTGLLEITFAVEPTLPPAFRVGLFAEPGTFKGWLRFSNSNGTAQPDSVKDVRGCAIKLRGVPGRRIPESDEPTTHDFVLVSMPTMPLGIVKLFRDAIYWNTEWSPLLFVAKMLVTGQKHVLDELTHGKINPTSPADIRYWSTTPYLFGSELAAKYSLTPTSTYKSFMPEIPFDDYLSENLQRDLAADDATFDFKVQLRTDSSTMPIEDAAVEWREDQAPFVKVATLRIPKQEFRTKERADLSEALAFSPGHALVEHRPIGAINRGRLRIYTEQSAFRHQRDHRRKMI